MEKFMEPEISCIRLPLPLNVSKVNVYLVKASGSYYLIDTGMTNARRQLEAELGRLGCLPGDLKLILLTHGDFDHTGNAVYLRQQYGSQIAMHKGDAGMLENGDRFWNRKIDNSVLKGVMSLLMPFKAQNRGQPEVLLEEASSLSAYGLDATVFKTPGHSSGSVCILPARGDLFCGALFTTSTGN